MRKNIFSVILVNVVFGSPLLKEKICDSVVKERIIKGEVARQNYPFIVGVVTSDGLCGGSIINENWILTAAHCLKSSSFEKVPHPSSVVIKLGNNKASKRFTLRVQKVLLHKYFNPTLLANDIALLKLALPIRFDGTTVNSIPIEVQHVGINQKVFVCGWGTWTKHGSTPDDLQCLNEMTISYDHCKAMYRNVPAEDGEICTTSAPGTGTCRGDSGGPLIWNNKLIGIVSAGPEDCANGGPELYTRVSFYARWINDTMTHH